MKFNQKLLYKNNDQPYKIVKNILLFTKKNWIKRIATKSDICCSLGQNLNVILLYSQISKNRFEFQIPFDNHKYYKQTSFKLLKS